MTTFAAQVRGWSDKAERNAKLVLRQAAQDVRDEAQMPVAKGGKMPVDTGFLRNSLVTSVNGVRSSTALKRLDLGDVAVIGWTASYAQAVHDGARGRPGRFFAIAAARRWPEFVARAAARLS